MAYRLIEQPSDSQNEPCVDCCFGNDNGGCNAPWDILERDDNCGFVWHGKSYIYKETKESKEMTTAEKIREAVKNKAAEHRRNGFGSHACALENVLNDVDKIIKEEGEPKPQWKPTKEELEAVRYLLEDYRPWLLSSADARKQLRKLYEEIKQL